MTIQLRDLSVSVRGIGKLTVQQDNNYTLLLMSLPTSTRISQAKSVIGSLSLNHELVNVGDSVQFTAGQNEVLAYKILCCTL